MDLLKFCAIIIGFYSITLYAATANEEVKVEMRSHGYTLGDVISMKVTFALSPHEKIDIDSLPLAGRVAPWLDIQSIRMEQHQQDVILLVDWQIFATVEIAQTLQTPEITLKTTGQKGRNIVIPKQAFYYSPVLPMPPLKEINRRANSPAPLFDATQPLLIAFVCFTFSVLFWIFRLWLLDKLPWLPYQLGPMAHLVRNFRKQVDLKTEGFTKDQLRNIHGALNQSAGCSLYPDNLSTLFQQAPYFEPERKRIEQFFNDSWTSFYHGNCATHKIDMPQTLAWIQRIAIAERLYWRHQQSAVVPRRL